MFFDDRLATVLRHRAAGEHAARTQYRQLLDLLGNRKYGRDESLVAAAWLRLAALSEQIPAAERAEMVRERGWRFRSAELALRLADAEPAVAAAALSRADLEPADWLELIPALPIRARGFLRLRRDLPTEVEALLERLGVTDRGLPEPAGMRAARESVAAPARENEADTGEEPLELDTPLVEDEATTPDIVPPANEPAPSPERPIMFGSDGADTPEPTADPVEDILSDTGAQPSGEKSEIAALVERIEQFKRERTSPPPPVDTSPRLPLEEEPDSRPRGIAGFGFVADTAGRIEWAEDGIAPMVVGKRLLPPRRLGAQASRNPLVRAFTARQPIEGCTLTLAGAPAIAGEWIVDASPRFSESSGRFHGYAGRFRRIQPVDPSRTPAAREADRIRQLLHELRTPVNALQGFAEVIQQQIFGPAPHEYRALAAGIAGDAARILAGFDEMERLAKLEGQVIALGAGDTDLGALVGRMVERLQQVLSPRMAGFDFDPVPEGAVMVAIGEDEAEALAWRVLATLASGCGAGDALAARLTGDSGLARLACDLPPQLIAEGDVFAARVTNSGQGLSAGLFGAGFSLRLARAEARSAGGDLVQDESVLVLTLPLAAAPADRPEGDSDPAALQPGENDRAGTVN